MKFKKLICAASAALIAVGLCGCSIKFGTNITPDNGYIVAKPSDSALADKLGVTYAEFINDYTYYLNAAGIKDDSSESVAETCKSRRSAIIGSLIFEKICAYKAEEYGVSELSEAEIEQAKSMADTIINERISYYAKNSDFGTIGGEELSGEEKLKLGGEMLDKELAKLGLTRDDYVEKQKRYVLSYKLLKAFGEKMDRGEAEKVFDENAKTAKEAYEKSPSDYEKGDYTQYYIPEGSRYIKHILLGFDNDIVTQIRTLRSSDDDAGADKLREESAAALDEKLSEVVGKLDAGEDFDELIKEYSADSSASAYYPDGYVLIPNGTSFMKEFQNAAFSIEETGGKTTCVTDYGIHILLYNGAATVTDDEKQSIIDNILASLTAKEFTAKTQEWIKEYGFSDNMDYNALRIDKPSDKENPK